MHLVYIGELSRRKFKISHQGSPHGQPADHFTHRATMDRLR
jgi:hypothetical protein